MGSQVSLGQPAPRTQQVLTGDRCPADAAVEEVPVVSLGARPAGGAPRQLFVLLPDRENLAFARGLMNRAAPDYEVACVLPPHPDALARLSSAEVARRYAQAIRAHATSDAVDLAGFCIAGHVMLAVVAPLGELGVATRSCVLLDTGMFLSDIRRVGLEAALLLPPSPGDFDFLKPALEGLRAALFDSPLDEAALRGQANAYAEQLDLERLQEVIDLYRDPFSLVPPHRLAVFLRDWARFLCLSVRCEVRDYPGPVRLILSRQGRRRDPLLPRRAVLRPAEPGVRDYHQSRWSSRTPHLTVYSTSLVHTGLISTDIVIQALRMP